MDPTHRQLLKEFEILATKASSANALMKDVADQLHQKMSRYNWVGFYLVDPADSNYLIVGPFAGSFTPNQRIPLNRGLCGAAAIEGKTIVVQDVAKDPRYLAGSNLVKSEIVVPIYALKKLIGELDIESYFPATFTAAEVEFIEAIAQIVARHSEKPLALQSK